MSHFENISATSKLHAPIVKRLQTMFARNRTKGVGMLDIASESKLRLARTTSAQVLTQQAADLARNPFSQTLQQRAQAAFVDYFGTQAPLQAVERGTLMFERARCDPQLDPPLRHVLLRAVDSSLAKVSASFRAADAPLCKFAALDTWHSHVHARVLDAIARAHRGCVLVPLCAVEQATERKQHALLALVLPGHLGAMRALVKGHDPKDPWQQSFAQHLRRLLFLTLDATLSCADLDRLLLFLATPAGSTWLAVRQAQAAPMGDRAATRPAPDPPELAALQQALHKTLAEVADADPREHQFYLTELAARMQRGLHETF